MRLLLTIVVLSISIFPIGVSYAGEPGLSKATDDWALHVHDLRPLLKGPKGQVDFELRDVHIRALINVLKDSTGADNWTAGDATIREIDGVLYIKQRESIHAQIRQILQNLIAELGAAPAEVLPRKNTAQMALHVYDLRPLVEQIPQFPDIYSKGTPDKNDDPKIEDSINFLKEVTGPDNWTNGEGSIRESKGFLYVRQTESVQTQLRQAMTELIKKKRTQIRVQIHILKAAGPMKPQLGAAEFNDVTAREGSDATVYRTEILCYSGQNAVAGGGRDQPYLETFCASTEGGGSVSGVREAAGSPLQEGLTAIVRPVVTPDGNVDLSLRLALVNNLSWHRPTIEDHMAMDMAKLPVEKKSADAKGEKIDEDRTALFSLPARDSSRLLTSFVAPRDAWVLAGAVQSPPEEKKLLYVFVKAETEQR